MKLANGHDFSPSKIYFEKVNMQSQEKVTWLNYGYKLIYQNTK